MLDGFKLRANPIYERGHRGIHKEGACAGMIENVFDLVRRDAKIDGHVTGAHLRDAVIMLKVAMAVKREHGHAVTLAEAQSGQRIREATCSHSGLLKGQAR